MILKSKFSCSSMCKKNQFTTEHSSSMTKSKWQNPCHRTSSYNSKPAKHHCFPHCWFKLTFLLVYHFFLVVWLHENYKVSSCSLYINMYTYTHLSQIQYYNDLTRRNQNLFTLNNLYSCHSEETWLHRWKSWISETTRGA